MNKETFSKILYSCQKLMSDSPDTSTLIMKAQTGRHLLLYVSSVVWLILIILHHTIGYIHDLTLVHIIFMLFLFEYLVFNHLYNKKLVIRFVYCSTFPINLSLIFLFILVVGASKIVFLILPILYLLFTLVIHGIRQGIVTLFVALIWYISLALVLPDNRVEMLISVGLLFLVAPIGAWLHFYNSKADNTIILTTNELPPAAQNNTLQVETIESLTQKEVDVINYILDGLLNKEIARKMDISENTVKYHMKNIYRKLNVSSKPELMKAVVSMFNYPNG